MNEEKQMSLLNSVSEKFKKQQSEELTVTEYLELCKKDPKAYSSPFERMLDAIAEPDRR